jgi:hypothetical protein
LTKTVNQQKKMNILLELENINSNNIFFNETKQNMMFDGLFTKILYCDDNFTMYGIYACVHEEPSNTGKPLIDAQTYNMLIKLESTILTAYAKTRQYPSDNIVTYKLSELLKTKFTVSNRHTQSDKISCLKISGIWENNTTQEIGLSFKL